MACLALGAALLGLRAGGAAVGWAFQLQDPRTILLLFLLSLATILVIGLIGVLLEIFFDACEPRDGTTFGNEYARLARVGEERHGRLGVHQDQVPQP